MASSNLYTIISSPMNVSFEFRIEDFQTANGWRKEEKTIGGKDQDLHFYFSASVSPNGINEDTEGWILGCASVKLEPAKYKPRDYEVSWILSVTDIEGTQRFPRSSMQERRPCGHCCDYARYIPKSFILDRADEFLLGDALTLRCDIFFQWYNAERIEEDYERRKIEAGVLRFKPELDHEGASEAGESVTEPVDHDKKIHILIDTFLHVTGKVGTVYLISYLPSDSESEEETDSKIWSFETRDKSFYIVLDKELDKLGGRLLEASPVLTLCVNSPMKEQKEKSIKLPTFGSQTFINAAYFVLEKKFPDLACEELFELYKFAHFFQMGDLQRKCADDMVNNRLEHGTDFQELKDIADGYSDTYFSKILRN